MLGNLCRAIGYPMKIPSDVGIQASNLCQIFLIFWLRPQSKGLSSPSVPVPVESHKIRAELTSIAMPPSKRRRTCSSRTSISTPQVPRTHSFTGCGNCRDRHVKCDLGTPNYLNCSRLMLSCEGYSRKYQWIPSKFSKKGRSIPSTLPVDDAEGTQTSRRVLYSGQANDKGSGVWC